MSFMCIHTSRMISKAKVVLEQNIEILEGVKHNQIGRNLMRNLSVSLVLTLTITLAFSLILMINPAVSFILTLTLILALFRI